MPEPDFNFPEPPIKQAATAGVAALGASLLFPSYAGAAAFAGGSIVTPVLAILAAGTAGWYIGKWLCNTSAGRAQEKTEQTRAATIQAAELQMGESPAKEWAKSVQRDSGMLER